MQAPEPIEWFLNRDFIPAEIDAFIEGRLGEIGWGQGTGGAWVVSDRQRDDLATGSSRGDPPRRRDRSTRERDRRRSWGSRRLGPVEQFP